MSKNPEIEPRDPHRLKKLKNVNLLILGVILTTILALVLFNLFQDNSPLLTKESGQPQKVLFEDDFSKYPDYSEILDQPVEDLSRWQESGTLTAWVEIDNWQEIERLDFRLTDDKGSSVLFEGLDNQTHLLRQDNQIRPNDDFVDYNFTCDQNLVEWEDFMLVNGKNLIFYEYTEAPDIDMSNIVSWQALDGRRQLEVSEVVMHDALCMKKNSLNGQWHSPNGLPQYGVFWPKEDQLVLRNVREEQYPSNGGVARILSTENTPENFLAKVRFSITKIKDRQGGYVRLGWDFDNSYSQGTDQSMIYLSAEYNYFGTQRTYPENLSFKQITEPEVGSSAEGKTRFDLKPNQTYEIQAKIEGQSVFAELYEVGKEDSKKVATIKYTFQEVRPEPNYPLTFEILGNIEANLDEFTVWEI